MLRVVLLVGVAAGAAFALFVLSVAASPDSDLAIVRAWAAVAATMLGGLLAIGGGALAVVAFALQALVRPRPRYAWPCALVTAAGLAVAMVGLWWSVVVAEDPNYPTRDAHVLAIGSLVVPAGLYALALAGASVALGRSLARAARTNLPAARVV